MFLKALSFVVMFAISSWSAADEVDNIVDPMKTELRTLLAQESCDAECRQQLRYEGQMEVAQAVMEAVALACVPCEGGDGNGGGGNGGGGNGGGGGEFEESEDLSVVTTFESAGLYLDAAGTGDCDATCDEVTVQYREAGQTEWKDAHEMVYGPGGWEEEYRSSIVHLTPDTDYEVLVTRDGAEEHFQTFTTWAETTEWPQGTVTTFPDHNGTDAISVTVSGTAEGYHVVDATGVTVDGGSRCLTVDADFVIVRGLTCVNQTDTPVRIEDDHQDVLLEDMEVSDFTFPSTAGDANEPVIELGANDGRNDMCRVVIQRTHIHSPQWGLPTTDWGSSLYGILGREEHCGNHVFRWNSLVASIDHMWRDAFGGFRNNSEWGYPGSDTDIYGNYISHCGDDCIETEGGNANLRIWGNYMHRYGVGIAVAGLARGPVYIFRNVVGEADAIARNVCDLSGQIKTGSGSLSCDTGNCTDDDYGRHYLYHNTFPQLEGPSATSCEAVSSISRGNNWSNGPLAQTGVNNIFHVSDGNTGLSDSACHSGDQDMSHRNTLFWDTNALNSCVEQVNLQRAEPDWADFSGVINPGDSYLARLNTGTPGHDEGEVIPNFSDGFTGSAPDIGAMEHDQAAMCFGHTC